MQDDIRDIVTPANAAMHTGRIVLSVTMYVSYTYFRFILFSMDYYYILNDTFCRSRDNTQLSFNAPYEQRETCATPNVILQQFANIPGDGNCLFHLIIEVPQLLISVLI